MFCIKLILVEILAKIELISVHLIATLLSLLWDMFTLSWCKWDYYFLFLNQFPLSIFLYRIFSVTKQLPDTEQACLHICTCTLFFFWPEVIFNAYILEEKLTPAWINTICELGATHVSYTLNKHKAILEKYFGTLSLYFIYISVTQRQGECLFH